MQQVLKAGLDAERLGKNKQRAMPRRSSIESAPQPLLARYKRYTMVYPMRSAHVANAKGAERKVRRAPKIRGLQERHTAFGKRTVAHRRTRTRDSRERRSAKKAMGRARTKRRQPKKALEMPPKP